MVIQEPVQANIWHCLNYYAYTDAELLAERLYAEVGTEEALHMLATCYYRSGKPNRAYTLLKNKGCPTPQCRYLLAQCCLDINKLSEAEAALMGNVLLKNKTLEDLINEHGDAACHALRLLGNIYSKTERHTKAKETFNRSLKLNPFLWSSFSNLCKLGEKPDPTKTFALSGQSHNTGCQNVFPIPTPPPTINIPTTINIQSPAPQTPQLPETPAPMNIDSPMESPLATMPNDSQIISPTPEPLSGVGTPENLTMPAMPMAPRTARCNRTSSMLGGPAALSPLTPSFGVLPLENTPSTTPVYSYLFEQSVPEAKPPAVKKQMTRRSQQVHNKPVFSMSGNTNSMRDIQTSCQQQGLQASNTTLRRSSRLFSNSNASSSSVKENNKSQSQNQNKKIAPTRAPVKKSRSKLAKTQELNELNKSDLSDSKPATQSKDVNAQMAQMQKQSAEGLLQLLQQIGKAYVALSQYDCAKAVSLFSALPSHQYSTGWVMCQVGRAYYEMADYKKAEKIFSEVRQLEPHHLDGMEYYSNTLWHLQKEVQLSALAQELTETDKEAPETWCAVGNCFSLQREHDVAIKFFQRAIQVRPNFAYAYTLLGHEYVSTEELDKALACFRNAIRVNPRHFNSWYGVGVVYYKQEKFALAEVHYRKALSINPKNCVLLCHIGDVLHAMKKTDQALATFSQAIKVDPKNELCKFHRASILFSTDRHKEALMELEELKELVPKESTVYFLIGKVHKKLGRTDLALMNFSWAMDLDPKGANNQIKELIDKRYVTDEDDPAAWGEGPSAIEDPMEGSSNNSSSLDTEAVDAEDVQLHAIESDESL